MTGGRPHLPKARFCEKLGYIWLRHRGSHSANDLPFGCRRYGHLPTAACWGLQRELGSTRDPTPMIAEFLRGSGRGGSDPRPEGRTRGGRQGQVPERYKAMSSEIGCRRNFQRNDPTKADVGNACDKRVTCVQESERVGHG